jgi:hypothetical protein
MPRSANDICCGCYILPILLDLCRSYCFTFYPEPAYNLGSTDWKRKYDKTKMKIKEKEKIMTSAAVPGQYQTIDTIFDPP